ncbi:MAG: DUF2299 family protein [Methanomassiliicoccales archaeon]|nr:DUF2299 family protein [Methanomassiliicoccales archaeon]
MGDRPINMAPKKGKDVADQVRHWAAVSGLDAVPMSDLGSDLAFELSEHGALPSAMTVHHKVDDAYVVIQTMVRVPDAERQILIASDPSRFRDLVWNIRLDLARADVEIVVHGADMDPDTWEVRKRLFLEGTDAAMFFDAYSRVISASKCVIWSYKRALDLAPGHDRSPKEVVSADRDQRVLYAAFNTSILLMTSFMEGFTKVMTDTVGAMASGMAEAMGGEDAAEDVRNEVREGVADAEESRRTMICEERREVYAQIAQKRKKIEPLLGDPIFDIGPGIIQRHDFGMPKLTEPLDDEVMVAYAKLLVDEDPTFTEMFKELVEWVNSLPQEDVSGEDPAP